MEVGKIFDPILVVYRISSCVFAKLGLKLYSCWRQGELDTYVFEVRKKFK